MSDARIEEIRTRTDAASPGHWGTHYDGKGTYTVEARPRLDPRAGSVDEGAVATLTGEHGDQQAYQDARFIAHAREDVPYLLDRVAELEVRLREHAHELGEGAAWNWWDAAVIPGECANLIDPPASTVPKES
ncbi:hypothetical protein OG582_40545 (plasmid) [Streptomyces anulatus]|uniref:hypothetical protein n=1 Tax=Streptomyces anulatus TaxID=1892 RepID=UPI00324F1AFB